MYAYAEEWNLTGYQLGGLWLRCRWILNGLVYGGKSYDNMIFLWRHYDAPPPPPPHNCMASFAIVVPPRVFLSLSRGDLVECICLAALAKCCCHLSVNVYLPCSICVTHGIDNRVNDVVFGISNLANFSCRFRIQNLDLPCRVEFLELHMAHGILFAVDISDLFFLSMASFYSCFVANVHECYGETLWSTQCYGKIAPSISQFDQPLLQNVISPPYINPVHIWEPAVSSLCLHIPMAMAPGIHEQAQFWLKGWTSMSLAFTFVNYCAMGYMYLNVLLYHAWQQICSIPNYHIRMRID